MIERRTRRRRRRLSRGRLALVAGAVVLLLGLAALVAGALRAGSESSRYQRAVNRSYALEVRDIVARSTLLDRQFRALVGAMPRLRRLALEATLDTLVHTADAIAASARTAATPAPSGRAGVDVAAAMADRARAVSDLRALVDRLLGMSPLPPPARPDAVAAVAPRRLSASGAVRALGEVSGLLAQGDRAYSAARRALRAAPGRAAIPPSAWAGRAVSFTSGAASALVDSLTGSSTLVAVHDIELVTHALVLTPAPVPPATPTSAPGTVLPPTGRVQITAVVSNRGNVAERNIVVEAAIRPAGTSGTGTVRRRTVSLGVHDSVSVAMPALPVSPNRHYTITVSVLPPTPDAPGAVTSDTLTAEIAPPATPVVGQLQPAKGPPGTDVVIFGTGFTWVHAVDFGTVPAKFVVVSSGQITVLVPKGARRTGTVAVRVVNPGGPSALSPKDRFTYRAK